MPQKLPTMPTAPMPLEKLTMIQKREHRRHSVEHRKIRRRGITGQYYRADAEDAKGWEPVHLNPIIKDVKPVVQPRITKKKPKNTPGAIRPKTPVEGQKVIDARSIRRRNINGGVYRPDKVDAESWTNPKEITVAPELLPTPAVRYGPLPPSYIEAAKMNVVADVRGNLKDDARKVRRRNPIGHFYRHDDDDAKSWEKVGTQSAREADISKATSNVRPQFQMPNNGDFIGIYNPSAMEKHFPKRPPQSARNAPRPGGVSWATMEKIVATRIAHNRESYGTGGSGITVQC